MMIALLILLASAFFSSQIELNSDLLYTEMLFRDLFSPFKMNGWKFTPAPSFFPDIALILPLRALTGDFRLALFFYVAIFLSGLYLIWKATLELVFREKVVSVFNCFFAVFLLLFTLSPIPHVRLFFAPIWHSGVFISGALAFYFLIKDIEGSRPRKKFSSQLVILFIVLILQLVSDTFFAVQFLLPLYGIVIFWWIAGWTSYSRIFRYTLGLCGTVLGAALLFRIFLFHRTGIHIANSVHPQTVLEQLQTIKETLPLGDPQVAILFLAPLTYLILGGIDVLKNLKKNFPRSTMHDKFTTSLYLLFIFSFGLNTLVVLNKSLWHGFDNIRYFYPFQVLPFFGLSALICKYLARIQSRAQDTKTFQVILLGIQGLAICVLVGSGIRQGARLPLLEYPAEVQCIDNLLTQEQRLLGLGGYWDAKLITALSRKNVRINQVTEDSIAPYHWINNMNWFKQDGLQQGPHTFALTLSADTAFLKNIENRFGKPLAKENCGKYTLLFYPKNQDLLDKIDLEWPPKL